VRMLYTAAGRVLRAAPPPSEHHAEAETECDGFTRRTLAGATRRVGLDEEGRQTAVRRSRPFDASLTRERGPGRSRRGFRHDSVEVLARGEPAMIFSRRPTKSDARRELLGEDLPDPATAVSAGFERRRRPRARPELASVGIASDQVSTCRTDWPSTAESDRRLARRPAAPGRARMAGLSRPRPAAAGRRPEGMQQVIVFDSPRPRAAKAPATLLRRSHLQKLCTPRRARVGISDPRDGCSR
jgi:hypothetical protein